MIAKPFALVAPSTRGLSLAMTRHLLQTTDLPVFATHRSEDTVVVRDHILSSLPNVDANRLHLLSMDLNSERSIAMAAQHLSESISTEGGSYIHTAFFGGGVLHPERQPKDLDAKNVDETFQINVISHLHIIKHFSPFLPNPGSSSNAELSKWVHVSARVGSVSDNRLGGWFSYRASKAALNQVIRTFDIYLQQKKIPAMCVGVHPGTVKTDLSKDFWGGVPKGKLFEPEYAAEKLAGVVHGLKDKDRGKVWDWAGKEVPP